MAWIGEVALLLLTDAKSLSRLLDEAYDARMYSIWEMRCDESESWRVMLPVGERPSEQDLDCVHGGAVVSEEFRPADALVLLLSGSFSRVHDDPDSSQMTSWHLCLLSPEGEPVRVSTKQMTRKQAEDMYLRLAGERLDVVKNRWERFKLGNGLQRQSSELGT